jgi:hypothetical protein
MTDSDGLLGVMAPQGLAVGPGRRLAGRRSGRAEVCEAAMAANMVATCSLCMSLFTVIHPHPLSLLLMAVLGVHNDSATSRLPGHLLMEVLGVDIQTLQVCAAESGYSAISRHICFCMPLSLIEELARDMEARTVSVRTHQQGMQDDLYLPVLTAEGQGVSSPAGARVCQTVLDPICPVLSIGN